MNNPTLSIVAAAHRIKYWPEYYESVCQNDISFEIIFVSDNHPKFKMPPNFRYIYSTVKPTQCVEIALREAKGEIIHWGTDDVSYSPHAFDIGYDFYKSKNNYKAMICFDIWETGFHKPDHFIFKNTTIECPPNTVRVIPYGLMSKKLIDEVGRCDTAFITGNWENDLVLRGYEAGGTVYVCENVIAHSDSRKHDGENNYKIYHHFESMILQDLWAENGLLTLKRKRPLKPFRNENLLIESQGNRGKW